MRLFFWGSELGAWTVRNRGLLQPSSWPVAFVALAYFGAGTIHGRDPITYEADTQGVLAVRVSPDGKLIAAGCGSGKVGFWDVAKRKEVAAIQASKEPIYVLAFSPDGKQLLTADENGVVRLWDVGSRKKRAELRGHKGRVFGFSFSPDGKWVATAGSDGTVRIWSRKGLKSRELIRIRGKSFTDVGFSPDGRNLAAQLFGGGLKLWKDDFSAEPVTIETEGGRLAFSPKGDRLALTGGYYFQLFELPSGRLLHSKKVFGSRSEDQTIYNETGRAIAFSPDGKLLAVGVWRTVQTILRPYHYGDVRLYDAKSLRQIRKLDGHTKAVEAVAFLPDGKTLISAGWDGTVRLWNVGVAR